MNRLGLIDGNGLFEHERDELVQAAFGLTDIDVMYPKPSKGKVYRTPEQHPEYMRLLPGLHALNPQAAEERIRLIGLSDVASGDVADNELIEAVAKIRSPYALDSLSHYAQKAVRAEAAAEVYHLRAEGEVIRKQKLDEVEEELKELAGEA
jgi:hypothetical protein